MKKILISIFVFLCFIILINVMVYSAESVDESFSVIKNDTLREEIRTNDSIDTKNGIAKEYISDEKRVLFSDGEEVLLNLQLKSDYEVAVLGWNDMDLIAWFNLSDFSGEDFVDNVRFYDVNNNYTELFKNYTFKYKTRENASVCDEFGKECEMFEDDVWVEFNSLKDLPKKDLEIGLFTDIIEGDKIEWVIEKDGFYILEWALVEGTNCGFVLVAPTADPVGTKYVIDGNARTTKFTSPSNAVRVIEMGCYISAESGSTKNSELAVYDHDSVNNRPGNIVGAKTTLGINDVGWHARTSLDIPISGDTIYWLALQVDSALGDTELDATANVGVGGWQTGVSTLANPFGAMSSSTHFNAIYAVFEEEDPCEYSGSGDWNVDCADECIITTNTNLPANTLNLYGTGTFTISANITANKVIKENTCQMINKAGDGNRLIVKLG